MENSKYANSADTTLATCARKRDKVSASSMGNASRKASTKKADTTADKAALSATRRSERMETKTEPASIKAVVPK